MGGWRPVTQNRGLPMQGVRSPATVPGYERRLETWLAGDGSASVTAPLGSHGSDGSGGTLPPLRGPSIAIRCRWPSRWETRDFLTIWSTLGDGTVMSPAGHASGPSLVDSLETYLAEIPKPGRPDALHQVFYGFYTRVAIIDRTIFELGAWAKSDAGTLADGIGPLAEALRDNSLSVGQELFASRIRAMSAMGYISKRMISLLNGAPPPPFTLTHAIAFDHNVGEMRTYDLSTPDEHPELPYDPLTYDPHEP
jgi:hypothetical protein